MIESRTVLQTRHGALAVAYHSTPDGDCLSFSAGDLCLPSTLVRLHSSCLFGEAVSALDCDCGQQLAGSLAVIGGTGGVLIYLPQEGRGIGIAAKIEALEVQRVLAVDSYQAFARLGHAPDPRRYPQAVEALRDLEISDRIRLLSNNPRKRAALEDGGFTVVETLSLRYTVSALARPEMEMKERFGCHTIDFGKITFV